MKNAIVIGLFLSGTALFGQSQPQDNTLPLNRTHQTFERNSIPELNRTLRATHQTGDRIRTELPTTINRNAIRREKAKHESIQPHRRTH